MNFYHHAQVFLHKIRLVCVSRTSIVRIMRFLRLPFIYRAICKLQADALTNASWHYRTGPVLITHLHFFQCRATFSRGHLANWYSLLEFFDLSAAPITAISLMYRIVQQMSNLATYLSWLMKRSYLQKRIKQKF